MSRPKIATVNVFFPPQSIGGATRVMADNIDLLVRPHAREFDLVGFTTDHGRQKPYTVEAYLHQGIRVYRVGVPHRANMDWIPRDHRMGERFAEFLDFERPDLVHFHCVQRLTGSVVEEARKLRIPYVVTVHDAWWISDFQFLVGPDGTVYPDGHPDGNIHGALPEGIRPDESSERRRYLKGLLAGAAAVFPVSEAFAEIYRRNGVPSAISNRNGIRPRQWLPRKSSSSGRVRLAHIGGMSEHKGYHLFREALESGPFHNLEAVVVDLSKPMGYVHVEHWNGLPVTFVGKHPQDRIEELFARIDVLVAPSIWPESFGLVTREATQAGIWVVASDRGAIGEDVLDGIDGEIVDVSSSADLRRVFSRIDADPVRYLEPMPAADMPSVKAQVDCLASAYRKILAHRSQENVEENVELCVPEGRN